MDDRSSCVALRRRSPRARVRGLTLVEVMLTSAVLAIGVIALVHTYTQAESGIRSSRLKTTALRIAEQRIEWLATMPIDRIAGCASPTIGCRTARDTFAPVLGNVGTFRCTQTVDDMGFHDPDNATVGQFRVDTAVRTHPDPRQQAGAVVISVSVCWSPTPGFVEQVQLQRMVVPEV